VRGDGETFDFLTLDLIWLDLAWTLVGERERERERTMLT
jgi:hypothetical protein